MTTIHVQPANDLIAHEDDDCPCGPTIEPIETNTGGVNWVIVHNSLDDREAHE